MRKLTHSDEPVRRGEADEARLPKPTPQFRRRAWREFQRALDPLGPLKPLRLSRQR